MPCTSRFSASGTWAFALGRRLAVGPVRSEGFSFSTASEAAASTMRPRMTRMPALYNLPDVRALVAVARALRLGHENRVVAHGFNSAVMLKLTSWSILRQI